MIDIDSKDQTKEQNNDREGGKSAGAKLTRAMVVIGLAISKNPGGSFVYMLASASADARTLA